MFQIDRTIDLTQRAHTHSRPRQGHTSGEWTCVSTVNVSSLFPLPNVLRNGCTRSRFGREGSGQRRPEVIGVDCILFVS